MTLQLSGSSYSQGFMTANTDDYSAGEPKEPSNFFDVIMKVGDEAVKKTLKSLEKGSSKTSDQ